MLLLHKHDSRKSCIMVLRGFEESCILVSLTTLDLSRNDTYVIDAIGSGQSVICVQYK